jgi:hypothetical protein
MGSIQTAVAGIAERKEGIIVIRQIESAIDGMIPTITIVVIIGISTARV